MKSSSPALVSSALFTQTDNEPRLEAALQVRSKAAKIEEEKQAVERRMQDRLDQKEESSRAAQEEAAQRVARMEEELRQSSSNSGSKPPAGSHPPAMAAPGRASDSSQRIEDLLDDIFCKEVCNKKNGMADEGTM